MQCQHPQTGIEQPLHQQPVRPLDGNQHDLQPRVRRMVLANESRQIKAALADDPTAFVRTVYQQSRGYNEFVFRSAVFGVEACTFG